MTETTVQDPERIAVGELTIRFLAEGAADGTAASLFEFTVPAGAKVPAAHRHDGYVETIYGLRGVLTMTVDGEASAIGAGDVLRIERGVAHRFDNHGEAEATALAIVTPGLLGPEYFRELGALLAGGGPPDPAAIGAVMRRHGISPA